MRWHSEPADTIQTAKNRKCKIILTTPLLIIPLWGTTRPCHILPNNIHRRFPVMEVIDLEYFRHVRIYLQGGAARNFSSHGFPNPCRSLYKISPRRTSLR